MAESSEDARRCGGCGAVWGEDARWCGTCGAELSAAAVAVEPTTGADGHTTADVPVVDGAEVRAGAPGRRHTAWGRAAGAAVALTLVIGLATTGRLDDGSDDDGAGPDEPTIAPGDGVAIERPTDDEPTCLDDEECLRWTVPLGGTDPTATATQDLAILGSRSMLRAIDLGDGTTRWERGDVDLAAPLEIHDDTAFVTVDGALVAIDPRTGADRWREAQEPDRRRTRIPDLAALDDGWLAAGPVVEGDVSDLAVTALDDAGRTRWHVTGDIAAADEHGAVVVDDGQLRALDVDGQVRWEREVGDVDAVAVAGPAVALRWQGVGPGHEVVRRSDGDPFGLTGELSTVDDQEASPDDPSRAGMAMVWSGRRAEPADDGARSVSDPSDEPRTYLLDGDEVAWSVADEVLPCCVVAASGSTVRALVVEDDERVVLDRRDGRVLDVDPEPGPTPETFPVVSFAPQRIDGALADVLLVDDTPVATVPDRRLTSIVVTDELLLVRSGDWLLAIERASLDDA